MARLIGVSLGLGLAAAAGCFGAAGAQTMPDPMSYGKVWEEIAFEAADTNGDNLVDAGEFARDAAAAFVELDRNADRRLTAAELGSDAAKAFARIDANADGGLTFVEIMNYKMKAFTAADANHDDAISFDEMIGAVNAEIGRRP